MAKDRSNKSHKSSSNHSPQSDADYDLDRSFSRVRPYTRTSSRKSQLQRTTDPTTDNKHIRSTTIENVDEYGLKTFTDANWNLYTRLEDKFDNFSDKNDEAHTSLRQELEQKVISVNDKCDKKVSMSVFTWIISGLVVIAAAIVTIWWNISYTNVATLPNEVHELNTRVNRLEEPNQHVTLQDSVKAVKK